MRAPPDNPRACAPRARAPPSSKTELRRRLRRRRLHRAPNASRARRHRCDPRAPLEAPSRLARFQEEPPSRGPPPAPSPHLSGGGGARLGAPSLEAALNAGVSELGLGQLAEVVAHHADDRAHRLVRGCVLGAGRVTGPGGSSARARPRGGTRHMPGANSIDTFHDVDEQRSPWSEGWGGGRNLWSVSATRSLGLGEHREPAPPRTTE